jgi:hypothetical protein
MIGCLPVASRHVYNAVRKEASRLLHTQSTCHPLLLPLLSLQHPDQTALSPMKQGSEWVLAFYFANEKSFLLKSNGMLMHNWILPELNQRCKLFTNTILMGELFENRKLYFTDCAVISGNYVLQHAHEYRQQLLRHLKYCVPDLNLVEELNADTSRVWFRG